MIKVRHVLGISGGKDSAALAVYMKQKYPDLPVEYYNADTGKELEETNNLISKLKSFLGNIAILRAAEGSPEKNPFDHFLKIYRGYLPSPQARWCTKKMKLDVFEDYIGNDYAISYVGIRGDEEREGYVSTKPNIQSIFPFRKNIWSLDVINKVFCNESMVKVADLYQKYAAQDELIELLEIVDRPLTKTFYYSKKINGLMDINLKLFNKIVFEFLKTTDYPVGKLDEFPLIENEEVLVKNDIFKLLENSGIGIPDYYKEIEFEVDGHKAMYSRSRSGCYFCFFQQKIEWVWLYEQHPDLYKQALEYEKDGYTWNQEERLVDLVKPERIRKIKLEYLNRLENKKRRIRSPYLVDTFEEDDVNCVNCFV